MNEGVDKSVATDLVALDRDHPGFRDPVYRERRNLIARLAIEHRPGDPLPIVEYSPEENEVWRISLETLVPLHAERACRAFLERWPLLGFTPTRIPQLAEMDRLLRDLSGIGLRPVAGLVSPRTFLSELADGRFLSTQYVRHHSTPLYTPEPDVIHELVGHAAALAHPAFAGINRLFGEAAKVASEAEMEALTYAYWWTVEFGVVREDGELKALGAGLLSSFGELGRFRTEAELVPFSVERAGATPYDPTDYQPQLFVAESTEAMLGELERWLRGIVARAG